MLSFKPPSLWSFVIQQKKTYTEAIVLYKLFLTAAQPILFLLTEESQISSGFMFKSMLTNALTV